MIRDEDFPSEDEVRLSPDQYTSFILGIQWSNKFRASTPVLDDCVDEAEFLENFKRNLEKCREAMNPVLYVSEDQLAHHTDPKDFGFGNYLPARKTPEGKFTLPLYTK